MSARSRTIWGLFLTLAILGFMLATQARVQESRARDLDLQSTEELTALIGTLTQENDRLQAEVSDLRLTLMQGRYRSEDSSLELARQERSLVDLQQITGLAPGRGPGIEVRIEDELGELGAYELGQLVNELKSGGAEAIILNGRRLDFRSAFANAGRGILLDGDLVALPYELEAVGDPEGLFSSLTMAGGLIPTFESRPGVRVSLTKQTLIDAPADEVLPSFVHSEPVEE